MALVSNIDPVQTTRRLADWLVTQLPDGVDPKITDLQVSKESGMSAETIMFRASWLIDGARAEQRLVARVAPTGPGIYMDYDLPREAEVLRLVAQHSKLPELRVPAVLWSESDLNVLGAPFMIMEHVEGRVPRDDPPFTAAGWVLELSDAERALLYDNGLKAMAAVHAIPIEGLGLERMYEHSELGDNLVEQHCRYVEKMFAWASNGAANPVIEEGLHWLRIHPPQEVSEPCLCWGDGRLGNLAFADDLSVAAVLDWEAATLAVPEYDLGWWNFAMRHHSVGMGLPLPQGFPSSDELPAHFSQFSGRPMHDPKFWEVLNGVRFCCIAVRAAGLMVAGGLLPPDSTMAINNPATNVLAGILGIAAPAGEMASYVGNR